MSERNDLDLALKGQDFFTGAPMPRAALLNDALQHNLKLFQAYCEDLGAVLCPHIKTTMAPWIHNQQREAGAWGATVANVPQAQAVRGWGEWRILIAAQLSDPASLDWFASEGDGDCEIYCWVDSVKGVELLARAHSRVGAKNPARVFLEIGYPGGRTGCRDRASTLEVAAAIERTPSVELHGISAFEGTIDKASEEETHEAVRRFLGQVGEIAEELTDKGAFATASKRPILTAGGSAYFDFVAEVLGPLTRDGGLLVLRSGCYVTHDCGLLDSLSPLGSKRGKGELRPALEVWGAVISTPEPGLAFAGLGKRNVSYDAGLPVPVRLRRDGATSELQPGLEVTALNDQHAYIKDPEGVLTVGDLIGVGISHPCTTFDKWRRLELVDSDYRVIGSVRTDF